MSCRRAIAVAVLAAALAPAAAGAQDAGPGSVLLVLDSSKSMNDSAGAGATRLDAAKAAVRELVGTLPPEARMGVRVYGAKVEESGRTAGCRDTELVVPVGPLDKAKLRSVVDGLQGKGRTPIGRSLLAAPDDLPAGGRRTLILVSDGGDNCAPPDPCRAAEQVAKRGVDMTIQVVGLQVNERVRRQLRCIARAGGGTYVDAKDPGALRDELLAAFARAFRAYEPAGTPVEGGPAITSAAGIGPGLYVDRFEPDTTKWYSVDLEPGERLLVAATAIPPDDLSGQAAVGVQVTDATGDRVAGDRSLLTGSGSERGRVVSVDARSPLAGGDNERFRPGAVRFNVSLEDAESLSGPVPVELAVSVLAPGERPRLVRAGGPLPGPASTPAPAATERPQATSGSGESTEDEDGGDGPGIALAGLGGLTIGMAGGFTAVRRRRP